MRINVLPTALKTDRGTVIGSVHRSEMMLTMSALGHKRTYAAQQGMSALPPKAKRRFFCFSALHFNLNPGRTISYPNTRLERNPAGTLALIAGGFFAVDKQIDPVAMVFDSDAVLV